MDEIPEGVKQALAAPHDGGPAASLTPGTTLMPRPSCPHSRSSR